MLTYKGGEKKIHPLILKKIDKPIFIGKTPCTTTNPGSTCSTDYCCVLFFMLFFSDIYSFNKKIRRTLSVLLAVFIAYVNNEAGLRKGGEGRRIHKYEKKRELFC